MLGEQLEKIKEEALAMNAQAESSDSDVLEKLANLFGVEVESLIENNDFSDGFVYAFRGSEFSAEDMQALATINKIAINSRMMHQILNEDKNE